VILGRRILFSLDMRDYQKSLEKARELHKTSSPEVRSALEIVFTELVEDEDEKIRKKIIALFKGQIPSTSAEDNKKFVAWLEKQHEQKSTDKVEPKFKVGDIIKPKCYNETHSIKAIGERYYILDVDIKIPFRDEDDWELVEQNPAWSEEDEEIHRKCICAMRASACGFPEEEKFVEQVDNWLKSLKDRVQPQPKQEWSEEDDKFFEELHKEFSEGYEDASIEQLKDIYSRQLQWLESIKSRLTI